MDRRVQESTRTLIGRAGMPIGVRKVSPAKPQAAALATALGPCVAGLIQMRHPLAKLLLRFFLCIVHRGLDWIKGSGALQSSNLAPRVLRCRLCKTHLASACEPIRVLLV